MIQVSISRAFVLAILLFPTVSRGQQTRYVNFPIAGSFATVQEGVDAAQAGDVILLNTATYRENVVIPRGKDSLRLTGLPDSVIDGAGGVALIVRSNDVHVTGLTFSSSSLSAGFGIWLDGVTGNRIASNSFVGETAFSVIGISGNHDTELVQNTIESSSSFGVALVGNRVRVEGNRLIGPVTNTAILSVGEDSSVVTNEVWKAGTGIHVFCPVSCDGAVVDNVVRDAANGYRADLGARGITLDKNQSLSSDEVAIRIRVFGVVSDASLPPAFVATNNVVLDTGNGQPGFDVLGVDGFLANNVAREAGGDGFRVTGTNHQLESNAAIFNLGSGFRVATGSTGVEVATDNTALFNQGFGFRIDGGASTTKVDSTIGLLNNASDYCDQGTDTLSQLNNFGTGCPSGVTYYSNPVLATGEGLGDLADPDVLLHEGVYYLYPSGDRERYDVYFSNDLVYWARGPVVFDPFTPNVWAPDVFRDPVDGRFYLYYTVNLRVGVAVADTPVGPFVDQGVLVSNAIDAHMFRDNDGSYYLYFAALQAGSVSISVLPMVDPLTSGGAPVPLLHADQPWELEQGSPTIPVNEAPFMIEREGTYYLMYSGNHASSPFYGVGYATATNPLGPFVKDLDEPITQIGDGVLGPGHASFVTGPDGGLWMVYHQKKRVDPGWLRDIAIDAITFDELGVPRVDATRTKILPMQR